MSAFAKTMMVTAVMLGMMLEMLDMTIVNVALPQMMGAFGATGDQITWIVTSYMVSSAIVMPLTGYLVKRFGRRRLLLADMVLFLTASAACGAAQTLEEMVAFRVLQGAAGGTLAPLAQAVIMSTFDREKRGSAMAVFGLGIMVVPVLGPTLGGFLTDHMSWRWVFYVNLPIGLLALLLGFAYLPSESTAKEAKLDWVGLLFMAAFIASFELFLSQGNSREWFNSTYIQALAALSAVSGIAFIMHCWRMPDAIVYLQVFRDRNFTLSTVLAAGFAMAMFGGMTLLPMLLEQMLRYPAQAVGSIMMPRGLIMALAMVLFGRFAGRFDGRFLAFAGILVLGAGTYVYVLLPANISPFWAVVPGIVQGVGMAMFFIPSAMLTYDTLPKHLYDGAAGLYSVVRTMTSSLGVAIVGMILTQRGEVHWQILREQVSADNPAFQMWLDQRGMTISDPGFAPAIVGTVMQQGQLLGFQDTFLAISLIPIIVGPLVFLRKSVKRTQSTT